MPKPKPPKKADALRPLAATRTKKGGERTGKPARWPDSERIEEVQRLMTLRHSHASIVRMVSADPVFDADGKRLTSGFGVNERTVRYDLARIMADWREAAAVSRDDKVAAARSTAESMFRRSLARGQDRVAEGYFDKLCKIDGAYAPDQVKLLGQEAADRHGLSDAELDSAILAEIEALPPARRLALLAQAKKESA